MTERTTVLDNLKWFKFSILFHLDLLLFVRFEFGLEIFDAFQFCVTHLEFVKVVQLLSFPLLLGDGLQSGLSLLGSSADRFLRRVARNCHPTVLVGFSLVLGLSDDSILE